MAYYNRYWRHQSYKNEGLERALQHIHEAEELSRELGGTDKDVKKYFFALSGGELQRIFREYGAKYGRAKQEYAEQAFYEWKSGRRKMSGLVASRLFNLLPPKMPIGEKHKLVKNLWEQYCPVTQKIVNIGAEADENEVTSSITQYLMNIVVSYQIPAPLEKRFNWLSSGDVNVRQQLLNHLRQLEKELIIKGVSEKIPVCLDHLKKNGSATNKLSHKVQIGKNKLHLNFIANSNEISFKDFYTTPKNSSTNTDDSNSNIGCLVAIMLLILICIFANL